jgi:hypothetical protein
VRRTIRFLYRLYFVGQPYKAIPELSKLPPEERLKVIIAAQQSASWDMSNDMRTLFWAFVGVPFVPGIYYLFKWMGYPGLGWLFGAALFAVILVDLGKQETKIFHPHIRKVLKARADAAAKGTTGRANA